MRVLTSIVPLIALIECGQGQTALRQPDIQQAVNSALQVAPIPVGLSLRCVPSIEASLLADVERLRALRVSCADDLTQQLMA